MRLGTHPTHWLYIESHVGVDFTINDGIPAVLRRLADLIDRCALGPAQTPEDLNAIAWMRQSLEDFEATIIGLSQSAATYNRERSSTSSHRRELQAID